MFRISQLKMQWTFLVPMECAGQRLDHFLASHLSDIATRSQIQRWIERGGVSVQGLTTTKFGFKLDFGTEIQVRRPELPPAHLEPIPMEIPILWEEEEFAVVHKPPGIACHPGPGEDKPTLVNGLLHQFNKLSFHSNARRPGLVHRLDKPTEGVLLVAKSERAHSILAGFFQNRTIQKTYLAWVLQSPPDSQGSITKPIARHPVDRLKMTITEKGRNAISHYTTKEIIPTHNGRKFSLVEIELETGRTHQIRVHLQSIGCPVVGDSLYSRSWKEYENFGLLLLAQRIAFQHPFLPNKTIDVSIELPQRFLDFQRKCRNY